MCNVNVNGIKYDNGSFKINNLHFIVCNEGKGCIPKNVLEELDKDFPNEKLGDMWKTDINWRTNKI